MAQKSYDEKLEEILKKKAQLEAQEKAIKKRKSEDERRLIELGGIVESVLGRDTTEEDKIRFLNFLKKQEVNGKFFSKAMNNSSVTDETVEM